MTNPNREELVKLADELGAMSMRLSYEQDRVTVIAACEFLRRLTSSDSVVKVRELEWGPYPNPVLACDDVAVADITVFGGHKYQVQRDPNAAGYIAFLAPQFGSLFWESKGHDTLEAAKAAAQADYEARIRSALVEVPAVKGEPVPVAWRDIIKRPDERPLPTYGQIPWAQLGRDVNDATFARRTDFEFNDRVYPGHQMVLGINFNSLARIVDKYRYYGLPCEANPTVAPPADAGMRPTTEDILECISIELSVMAESWTGGPSGLANGDDVAEYLTGTVWANLATAIDALTAPGATTKSDGGVSLNDVREALERSIRELEYNRANHYSPDITTINRLKSQVLQAITKSDGGGESRPANPGTGGRVPCIEQTTPATMPAQAGVAPGPSDPSSTRSDPNEQAYADLIASGGIFPEVYQQSEPSMTDDQIKHMVDRFLTWKLPKHFNPDCGISFDQSYRSEHGPVGTNLFDAVQATAMVRHMLEGLPSSTRSDVTVESIEGLLRDHIEYGYERPYARYRKVVGFTEAARALLDQFEIRRKK